MTFEELLDQAVAMLQRHGRLTYRTLQRQFQLDDASLEDLKEQLLYAHPQIVDDAGRGLIWTRDERLLVSQSVIYSPHPGAVHLSSGLHSALDGSRSPRPGHGQEAKALLDELGG